MGKSRNNNIFLLVEVRNKSNENLRYLLNILYYLQAPAIANINDAIELLNGISGRLSAISGNRNRYVYIKKEFPVNMCLHGIWFMGRDSYEIIDIEQAIEFITNLVLNESLPQS